MIIAGGRTKDESPYIFGDGAAYDPTSDTWRKIAEGAGDSGLTNQAAWTGTALLTFAKGYGFAYDPTANTWKSLDRPAFSPSSSRVLWTGHDVLLIGTAALGTTPIGIVAAYRP